MVFISSHLKMFSSATFDIRWTSKGGFCRIKIGWFFEAEFLAAGTKIAPIPT